MVELRIGTAGIPVSAKPRSSLNGIKRLNELGLNHMELEFVRGVRMGEKTALAIREAAEKNDVSLTVHAPYYINLNSKEPEKIEASKERILQAARIGEMAGAKSVTFHPAYYHEDDPEDVYRQVVREIGCMLEVMAKENLKIRLSPETTGSLSQFGTLEELVRLGEKLPGVYPCVDFAHLYARSIGEFNSYEDFTQALQLIQDKFGEDALKAMHIHLSGIEYGPRGERNHLPLVETEFDYKAVLKALVDFEVGGWLTCESPILEEDALTFQKIYRELKHTKQEEMMG
ncbi:MAG TPA: TIM barrel protein [Firmicutes bacterium]|nr:TIM barrel protein [Bacillota bacterium]